MTLPPLCNRGHALVVSAFWEPDRSGSAVLMRNLLEGFDPSSYTVVARRPAHLGAVGLLPRSIGSRRLRGVLDRATEPGLTAAIAGLIASRRVAVVLATYPDLVHLAAAERAARLTGTPLVAYLHDTVTAASTHRGRAKRAARVEARIWAHSRHVFVMSQGMASLAAREGHAATPLEHVYPEGLSDPPTDPPEPMALWAGNVYEINSHAVARVSDAVGRAGLQMVFAGPKTVEQLAALGIRGDHVKTTFYGDRRSYLDALGGPRCWSSPSMATTSPTCTETNCRRYSPPRRRSMWRAGVPSSSTARKTGSSIPLPQSMGSRNA